MSTPDRGIARRGGATLSNPGRSFSLGPGSKMKIQFWFEFASTYSYLAAHRIQAVSEAARVDVVWEPFLLGPIFADRGLDDSPFNVHPEKGRYMWRDMERLCDNYGLAFRRPSVFPRNGLLAARVACLGAGKRWLPDFSRAVYRANFAEDRDIADESVIGDILGSLGVDAQTTLDGAGASQNKDRLRKQVDRARGLAIFGAPTFVVGRELFWGNDRMGDAIVWARTGAR